MAKKEYDKKYTTSSGLSFAVEGVSLPDIDVANIQEVLERAKYYLERCGADFQEPGVAGLCLWLGITTERWQGWLDGAEFQTTHQQPCQKLMTLLESRLEEQMLNGSVNPVTAMFLLKSQFGYVDTPKPKKSAKNTIVREIPMAEILRIAQKKK